MIALGKYILFIYHEYPAAIPAYHTKIRNLSYSAKGESHPLRFDQEAAARFSSSYELNYYNENNHMAAFALPDFVKELLNTNSNNVTNEHSAE